MVSITRRRCLSLTGGTAAGLSIAGCVSSILPANTPLPDGPTVGLDTVANGLTAPVGIEFPTGADRGYVVDQPGQVWIVDENGRRSDPFLDVSDKLVELSGYTEQGLLGIAFHPDYPDDGRVYVRYSAPRREGTPANFSHTFVLAEFTADRDRADPDSERTVLTIPQPQSNHNAGSVVFGPDGYLFVGVGDGGGGGDQGRGHVQDWYDPVPGGNGQDVVENLLGSILRIDVDGREGDRGYAIPPDNPLVGSVGLDEHYAWGFRNPWRVSFDGDRLFVADVGQTRYEEVNLVEKGGNYGWNVREGTHCFGAEECPMETPEGDPLLGPIIEYPHERNGETIGIAVVGGYRYRGDTVPELADAYVFGDWSGSFSTPQGSLFAAWPRDGDNQWTVRELAVAGREDGELGRFVLAFGRDTDGEVYVCTNGRSTVGGSSGAVHRIVPGPPGTATDAVTEADGLTTAGTATTENTPTDADTVTASPAGTTTGPTSERTPGFGIVGAALGLGGWLTFRRYRQR